MRPSEWNAAKIDAAEEKLRKQLVKQGMPERQAMAKANQAVRALIERDQNAEAE